MGPMPQGINARVVHLHTVHVLVFRQTGAEETTQQREGRKTKDSNGEGLPGMSHIIALETHSGFASTVIPDQCSILDANETCTLRPVRFRCPYYLGATQIAKPASNGVYEDIEALCLSRFLNAIPIHDPSWRSGLTSITTRLVPLPSSASPFNNSLRFMKVMRRLGSNMGLH